MMRQIVASRAGTLLCDEEDIVEKNPVTGIAYARDEAKITLLKIADKPGVAAQSSARWPMPASMST